MENTLDHKFDNFEDWFNHNQTFFMNENLSTKTIAGLAWEHAWYKNDDKKMTSPAPADICKGCDHYSPIDDTCDHSVEYKGEENEDCSLYILLNKTNDGDEYYG